MQLRPYKFQIVSVCQVVDDDGKVVGEQVVAGKDGPLNVFGMDGLREFTDSFEAKLEEGP